MLRARVLVASVLAVVVLAACGSSGGGNKAQPASTALGTGVTPTTINVGVQLIDFDCVKDVYDSMRPDEEQAYRIFFDAINASGGVNGRKLVPIIKKYCPINNASAASTCTSMTEDSHVFAVVGIFYTLTGDGQLCYAQRHNTVVVADSLTQALVAKARPGMMVSPNISDERRLDVILSLLKSQPVLQGKKVAAVSSAANKPRVTSTVVPALRGLNVQRGTDAILSVTGSDTTNAQAQLDSVIERWKTEGTNAVILVGSDMDAPQFVEKIKKNIPNMVLISDSTNLLDSGRTEQKNHVSPNPYDGSISAEGQTGVEHTKTPHFAYCRDIWERATGRKVPSPNEVVKLPNGKTNDLYGTVEDACLYTTFFANIAKKVGANLNNDNWVKTVDNFGAVDDVSTLCASLHAGKYDADDTYGLVAFDPSVGEAGDWRHLTPVQDVGGAEAKPCPGA